MLYISSSGGTCYEKLLLGQTCQVQNFRGSIYAEFRVRNQETHDKIEYMYKG